MAAIENKVRAEVGKNQGEKLNKEGAAIIPSVVQLRSQTLISTPESLQKAISQILKLAEDFKKTKEGKDSLAK